MTAALDRRMATGHTMLALPAGFEYTSFGYSAGFAAELGMPVNGDDGHPTPDRHDGMATFATEMDGVVRLVHNHERGYEAVPVGGTEGEPLIGNPDTAYDVNSRVRWGRRRAHAAARDGPVRARGDRGRPSTSAARSSILR